MQSIPIRRSAPLTRFAAAAAIAALLLVVSVTTACRTGEGAAPRMATEPPRPEAPASAAASADQPEPPMADIRPEDLEIHGDVRTDPYYWLKHRDDPEVIAYLEAENAYTEAMTAETEELRERLYEEIVERIPQEDESAPYLLDGSWYYRRFEEGEDYPVYARRKGSLDAPEEILLDVPAMAGGHEFYSLRGPEVGPEGRLIAYAVDTVGRRKYTIRFKDTVTGETLSDELPDRTGNMAWAEDGKTLFYSEQHPETLRSYRIRRHVLGTDPAEDPVVYEEPDEEFSVFVYKTRSRGYLMIHSSQTVTDEVRYLPADDPAAEPTVFLPRERGHEYRLDHAGDRFYLRTNRGGEAPDFELVSTPVGDTSRAAWEVVVPHREDVYLGGFVLFRDHLVVSERQGGLTRLRVLPRGQRGVSASSPPGGHVIEMAEQAYAVFLGDNPELGTDTLRFRYSSMTTPWTVYDYRMDTRERTVVKQDEVGGGFDPADYRTARIFAPARDGERIPVTLLFRDGVRPDGTHPLLLYGYGSYGATIDPSFSSPRLSLVDRGFVFAVAHVRGGQVFGRRWYEGGRLLAKKNTFTDFVDAAEHLVERGWADPERLYAEGGSAGGLLMGAVTNMRPDLWDGVVARVPFVDVVTTMLDPEIPLTTFEYDEWGNPNDPVYYAYMLSYSPYDNVRPAAYPAMLVTTGLHDSQVQYWEPAKWVAKLRATTTGERPILLRTNMEAGHGGATGRFQRERETAFIYAFLLDLAGCAGQDADGPKACRAALSAQ